MMFLLQIYVPIDNNPRAFHRILYVFTCTERKCFSKAQGGQGATCVMRLQLPRKNDLYPYSLEIGKPGLCKQRKKESRNGFFVESENQRAFCELEIEFDEEPPMNDLRKEAQAKEASILEKYKNVRCCFILHQRTGWDSFQPCELIFLIFQCRIYTRTRE